MDVKSETKILVIITICIMLVTVGLSGCIEDDNGEIIVDYLPPIANAGDNQTVFVIFRFLLCCCKRWLGREIF